MTTLATRRPAVAVETTTLGQLLARQFPTREALVGPFLREGESMMCWAAPGSGKSLLTLTMAVMVAGGGTVLGWHSPRPRPVLLVDGEMAAEDLQERARVLMDTIEGIDREAAARNLHIMARTLQRAEARFPDLGEREVAQGKREAGQDVVFKKAQEVGAALVVLDNFACLAEVQDENEASSMTPTLAFLLRLKQARIGCILVHHSGKTGENYRGSSKLATTFEVILGLRPLAEGGVAGGGAAFALAWTKFRGVPCEAVRPREVRLEAGPDGRRAWVAVETDDDDVRRVLEAVKTCAYTSGVQVGAALGILPCRVSRIKTAAIRAGRITEADWKLCMKEAAETALDTDATAADNGGDF